MLLSYFAQIFTFISSDVHNIIDDKKLILNTLESEDFFLWFLGAFTIAYFTFYQAKNKLDNDKKAVFKFWDWFKEGWDDIAWVFIGSFSLLIVWGFTGKVLFMNDVFTEPAGGYGAEAGFLIGLVGSFVMGKVVKQINKN